jgi:hypothetical protein
VDLSEENFKNIYFIQDLIPLTYNNLLQFLYTFLRYLEESGLLFFSYPRNVKVST